MANELETFLRDLRASVKEFAEKVSDGATKVAAGLHDPVTPLREALDDVWAQLTAEQIADLTDSTRQTCSENHEIISHGD
jgi:hypothetical protein